jgi:hypothetical protein
MKSEVVSSGTTASSKSATASSEVQAVQIQVPVLVQTGKGQRLASRGEWMITEADGTVRVLSDELFRMQTLRQQLTQMVIRGRWLGAKRS